MNKLIKLFIAISAVMLLSGSHTLRHTTADTVHQFHEQGQGCSAVMIEPEVALTARHCMYMTSPVLTIDGIDYPVTEGFGNPALDLAIIIIPSAPCPCASPAPQLVQEGDPVIAIGYPYGVGKVVTYGEFQGWVMIDGVLYGMTTAPARPGNSGGGMFNSKGELIGILTMADPTGYLTFFVSIEPLLNKVDLD